MILTLRLKNEYKWSTLYLLNNFNLMKTSNWGEMTLMNTKTFPVTFQEGKKKNGKN